MERPTALNGQHRKTKLTPDGQAALPIPHATARRNSRYQDACRLFLYGDHAGVRQTKFWDLAKRCHVSYDHLRRVAYDDCWEDFAAQAHARRHGITP